MIRNFIKSIGTMNCIMLLVVLVTIIIAEVLFLTVDKLNGLFVGLWAPTILGFMNFFKGRSQ